MLQPKKVFNQIYDQYIDKIYRFIFFKVSSLEITQDLTSEVFLRFWQCLESGTEIENHRAFLYQIARNLVIDYYRKKNQAQFVSFEDIQIKDAKIDIENQANFDSEMNRVHQALFKLKPEYQEVIVWHYLDDFSVKEIANLVNKSENAVRLIIHRALKQLRDIIP